MKFLVKPVTTRMVSAERTRSSHLSLGYPWHPQVAPIQAWQGEQFWPASCCCSVSLAGQEFFLAKGGGIFFTEVCPCRWTPRENKHQETHQNWDTQGQTERPEAEEGNEEALISPCFCTHRNLFISLFSVPLNCKCCHQWVWWEARAASFLFTVNQNPPEVNHSPSLPSSLSEGPWPLSPLCCQAFHLTLNRNTPASCFSIAACNLHNICSLSCTSHSWIAPVRPRCGIPGTPSGHRSFPLHSNGQQPSARCLYGNPFAQWLIHD